MILITVAVINMLSLLEQSNMASDKVRGHLSNKYGLLYSIRKKDKKHFFINKRQTTVFIDSLAQGLCYLSHPQQIIIQRDVNHLDVPMAPC